MTAGKIQLKQGIVAEPGEGAKAERKLSRLEDKAAVSIGGKTESIAKPKLSPQEQERLDKELVAALRARELDRAVRLFEAGADVNAKDEFGVTLLMQASIAPGHGSVDVVKKLISAGADVNAKDDKGWTALMRASLMGHTDIVQELIAHGADANAKNMIGWTALIVMSSSLGEDGIVVPRRHVEVAKELLKAGVDINAKDEYGKTALDYSYQYGKSELISFLEHGVVNDSSPFLDVLKKEAEKRKLGSFENWLEELKQALTGSNAFRDELAGFLLLVKHKGGLTVLAISTPDSEKETLNYVIVYDKSGAEYIVAGRYEEVFGSHDAIVLFLEKVLGRTLACSGGGYVDFGPDVLRAFSYSVQYRRGDHAKAEEMLRLIQLHLKKE